MFQKLWLRCEREMQHTQDSLDVLFQRLNDAKQAVQDVSNSVKNVGRALTGKELLEYVPWTREKGKIASVQRKGHAMERTLGNLQERTKIHYFLKCNVLSRNPRSR